MYKLFKAQILSLGKYINYKLMNSLPVSLRGVARASEGLAIGLLDPPDYHFPKIVGIESTNKCNLKCSHCPSHRGKSPRKEGFIDRGLFEKIISEIAEKSVKKEVQLHKDGEPLLHPEIAELITSAKNLGLTVKLTTNGLLFNTYLARQIFTSKIDEVEFSLGAARTETYKRLRGAKLIHLEETIRNAVAIRHEVQSPLFTHLVFQIIQTSATTVNEIVEFRKRWRSIPRSSVFVKEFVNWAGAFSGHDSHKERYPCCLLWIYPSINWNGRVSACCLDWKEELIIGNIYNQTVQDVWEGQGIRELRKMHINKCIPPGHPCYECNGWSFGPKIRGLRV